MSFADLVRHRTAASQPYWDAAHEGVLKIQECRACSRRQFYPRDLCHHCWSRELDWIVCSGRGVVHSYTVCHVAPHPDFASQLPLVIAIVDLQEGVRMTTNIIGCAAEVVHIGMPVEAVFEKVTDTASLVKFRPACSDGAAR